MGRPIDTITIDKLPHLDAHVLAEIPVLDMLQMQKILLSPSFSAQF